MNNKAVVFARDIYRQLSPLSQSVLKGLVLASAALIALDVAVYSSLKLAARADVIWLSDGLLPVLKLTDVGRELTIPAWYTTGLWFMSTTLAVLIAWTRRSGAWVVFALICAYLSLDELTSLHERLDPLAKSIIGDGSGLLTFEWVVIGVALAVGLALAGYQAVRTLEKPLRDLVFMAGGVFVTGALVFESISGAALDAFGDQIVYHSAMWVEEGLEMLGVSLLVAALVSAANLRQSGE